MDKNKVLSDSPAKIFWKNFLELKNSDKKFFWAGTAIWLLLLGLAAVETDLGVFFIDAFALTSLYVVTLIGNWKIMAGAR